MAWILHRTCQNHLTPQHDVWVAYYQVVKWVNATVWGTHVSSSVSTVEMVRALGGSELCQPGWKSLDQQTLG
ncbi:hypothetical protein Tco_1142545 [Tanacetum coccineum]